MNNLFEILYLKHFIFGNYTPEQQFSSSSEACWFPFAVFAKKKAIKNFKIFLIRKSHKKLAVKSNKQWLKSREFIARIWNILSNFFRIIRIYSKSCHIKYQFYCLMKIQFWSALNLCNRKETKMKSKLLEIIIKFYSSMFLSPRKWN